MPASSAAGCSDASKTNTLHVMDVDQQNMNDTTVQLSRANVLTVNSGDILNQFAAGKNTTTRNDSQITLTEGTPKTNYKKNTSS